MGNEKIKTISTGIKNYLTHDDFSIEVLKGDGSERSIQRVCDEKSNNTFIAVHHLDIQENIDFLKVTKLLKDADIPAPTVLFEFEDLSGYLLEDLGDKNLAESIEDWSSEDLDKKLKSAYSKVIHYLIKIQNINPAGFQLMSFKDDIMYFKKNFYHRFQFLNLEYDQLQQDLDSLLYNIQLLNFDCIVLRDFQSRNFMWVQDKPVFIDYQSAMKGPIHYDLASMLYASKSGLNEVQREFIIREFYEQKGIDIQFNSFVKELYWIVLIRRLRSLGSYAYLSLEMGKQHFFKSLKPSISEINFLLDQKGELQNFRFLNQTFKKIEKQWEQIESQVIKSV